MSSKKILIFIVLCFAVLTLNAATIAELKHQYNGLKIEYLKAVLNGYQEKEIQELEKLVTIGNKIGENTTNYKSELKRLKESQAKKEIKEQIKQEAQNEAATLTQSAPSFSGVEEVPTSQASVTEDISSSANTPQPQVSVAEQESPLKKSSKYSVESITNDENSITINFNTDVTANDIKGFELVDTKNFRSVFDITGTFPQASQTKLQMNEIERISVGQFKPNVVRIALANSSSLQTAYTVEKNRIIIKILNLSTKQKVEPPLKETTRELIKQPITSIKKSDPKAAPIIEETIEETPQIQKPLSAKVVQNKTLRKKRTIVIDAGHGGKDSGAVGINKKYEKEIVFKVSNFLYDILKNRGYEVHLTRKNDTFVELKDRTKLSNDKNADIFVSIHTNAIGKERADVAQGIETFFLSPARSERAKRVAALENEADMNSMNNNSQMTFLTVLNQSKITASNKLAIDIQQNVLYSARKSYSDIVDGGVREAPFWVLVGAQMPSVLVELGYISHKTEAQRLSDTTYQKQLAQGLADGIDAYFSKNDY